MVRKTGKCLFVWEFPTAIKRVSFSDDDEQIVCITEQHIGHQGAYGCSMPTATATAPCRRAAPPYYPLPSR